MVIEWKILKVFPIISLCERPNKFAHKGLDWQDICRGPLDIVIHTKYIQISYGPHGFIEDCSCFCLYKFMEVINPCLDPGAWLAGLMLWSTR